MKASEAKLLSSKASQLKLALRFEIDILYKNIKKSALDGLVAYHYQPIWLNQSGVDMQYLTKEIISRLEKDGYDVSLKDSNTKDSWLLISWM